MFADAVVVETDDVSTIKVDCGSVLPVIHEKQSDQFSPVHSDCSFRILTFEHWSSLNLSMQCRLSNQIKHISHE